MNRIEFEHFREAANKRITADIQLIPKPGNRSFLHAVGLTIENDLNIDARLAINYNPHTGSKVVSVVCDEAGGPICRLCVDGRDHGHGRSHRHSLFDENCPLNRLQKDIQPLPKLHNTDLITVLRYFFRTARIEFAGKVYPHSIRKRSKP